MNELQIFKSEEFGEVRTVTINNEPWFVGKDVTVALGYVDTKQAIRVNVADEDKKHLPKRAFWSSQVRRRFTLTNRVFPLF